MTPSQIEVLVAAYLDRRATAAELAELQSLLAANPAAVRQLVETVEIDTLLADRLSDRAERMQIAELLTSRSILTPVEPGEVPATLAAPPTRIPVLGFLASISRHVPGGEFTVGSLLILVVVAAFWGLSQAILYPRFGGTNLGESSAAQIADKESGKSEAVATIRGTTDAQWSRAPELSSRNQESGISPGEPLGITAGLVELQLTKGATLVIEGPADWKINGENSATLTRGKLVAKVPHQAIGFTLDTPQARIVDLGTEFGVAVDDEGAADVHVLRGRIDVQGNSRAGKTSNALQAGQSLQITSEGVVVPSSSPAIAEKFNRLAESGKKQPAESVANPTTGLVAYYPFDGDTRDHAAEVAANSGKTADDLKLSGQGEFLAGQVGKGLRLMGGFASAPFSPDVKLPPTFTIEAWIVAERLTSGYQRIVLNWGDDPTPIRVYHLSIKSRGLELAVGQTNHQYVRAEGGELKIERWQHIAGVADGKNLHVYLNGEEVATTPFDGTLAENDQEGLGIGDSQQGQGPTMRFRGAIDELAIWKVALSPEQIAAHAARGRHGYELARNRTLNGPSRISPLGNSEASPRLND